MTVFSFCFFSISVYISAYSSGCTETVTSAESTGDRVYAGICSAEAPTTEDYRSSVSTAPSIDHIFYVSITAHQLHWLRGVIFEV